MFCSVLVVVNWYHYENILCLYIYIYTTSSYLLDISFLFPPLISAKHRLILCKKSFPFSFFYWVFPHLKLLFFFLQYRSSTYNLFSLLVYVILLFSSACSSTYLFMDVYLSDLWFFCFLLIKISWNTIILQIKRNGPQSHCFCSIIKYIFS